jgi:hypothetical protein
MLADHTLTNRMIRGRLARLVEEHQHRSPSSRAEIVRGRMIDAVQPRSGARDEVSIPARSLIRWPRRTCARPADEGSCSCAR